MREIGLAVALALLGYGLTILLGLVAHEGTLVGWASLLLGLALLGAWAATAARRQGEAAPAPPAATATPFRWTVAALGVVASLGTVAYNLLVSSGLGAPEVALVAYGALLVASLPWLDRPAGPRATATVATLVAWSFPVVLAPLVIYALNGVLASQAGNQAAAASPLVRWALVEPTSWLLALLGQDAEVRGNALVLATPRGSLALSVGLVCAGIYPAVLFAGLFGLYAWDRRPPLATAAGQFAAGLAALWALNLGRMALLARVGVERGPEALQRVHDQAGWLLFAAFSAVYWWLVLRRPAPPPKPAPADA